MRQTIAADAVIKGGYFQIIGHASGRTGLAAAAPKRLAGADLVECGAQDSSGSSAAAACKCEPSWSLRATAAKLKVAAGSASIGSCLCFAPAGSTC